MTTLRQAIEAEVRADPSFGCLMDAERARCGLPVFGVCRCDGVPERHLPEAEIAARFASFTCPRREEPQGA